MRDRFRSISDSVDAHNRVEAEVSDQINVPTVELLRAAYTSPAGGVEGVEDDPAYAAQLALYARTQHAFYVAFQAVVLVLLSVC